MYTATLLLLIATLPHRGEHARVDMIEVNHQFDQGVACYDQVIFWRKNHEYGRYDVVEWRLVELGERNQLSKYPWVQNGRCVIRWFDVETKKRRSVESPIFRETWTSMEEDPERLNKKLTDEKFRGTIFPD